MEDVLPNILRYPAWPKLGANSSEVAIWAIRCAIAARSPDVVLFLFPASQGRPARIQVRLHEEEGLSREIGEFPFQAGNFIAEVSFVLGILGGTPVHGGHIRLYSHLRNLDDGHCFAHVFWNVATMDEGS